MFYIVSNLLSDVNNINFLNLRIPRIELNTVIDILIVAYILYKIMAWIEQTRAWSLFKGIALLAVVYFLAETLKLYTIRWIVSNTFSVGIIALIIIFQPEVRKALERIGKGNIMNKLALTESEDGKISGKSVDEIITAAKHMSKLRTGALLVLENQVKLGDLIATGTVLDAIITSGLIISIFEDKMPMHDGAIIISNNRVASAGCILPLTQAEIGQELGTRHRAAVGVSEVSDAKVIVVSNETGYISIADGGKLYKNLSEDEIRGMLSYDKKPPRRKLADRIRGRQA